MFAYYIYCSERESYISAGNGMVKSKAVMNLVHVWMVIYPFMSCTLHYIETGSFFGVFVYFIYVCYICIYMLATELGKMMFRDLGMMFALISLLFPLSCSAFVLKFLISSKCPSVVIIVCDLNIYMATLYFCIDFTTHNTAANICIWRDCGIS